MRIECPHCQKTLNAPDHKAGQVVNCPSCGGQMQLPAASAPAPSPAPGPAATPPAPAPTPPAPAPTSSGGKAVKTCPYCGEEILAVATKCKHCSSFLTGSMRGASGRGSLGRRARRRPASTGDGSRALIFGILGLLFCPILGIFAITYGNRARQHESERVMGTIGLVLGVIGVGFMVLWFLAIALGAAADAGGF
jgi:hypothetical protein